VNPSPDQAPPDRDLVSDVLRALDRAAHHTPAELRRGESKLQRLQQLINSLTTVDEIEAVALHVAARIEWMQKRGIES
jgi:hypothetical protein